MSAQAARSEETSDRLALLAFGLGAAAIGISPVLVRLSETGPAATGFWRLTLSLPLLAIPALRARGGLGLPSPVMMLAGVAFALDLACWHYGVRLTSVANATVLANLTPVLVVVAGWLWLKETPSRLLLIGLAVAMAGASAMGVADRGAGAVGRAPLVGDALSALAAVWYGLYFLSVRQARAARGALTIMVWSALIGAPIVLGIAVLLHEPILPTTPAGWSILAALGVMHAFGQGAIAWSLGRLQASTAAVTGLVQPVAAGVLGWLVFREVLTPLQGLGAGLALAGIVIAQWRPARTPSAA